MHLLIANNSAAGGAKAGAFESIASNTLGSNTASVTFSSIPATYQHLQLRILARGTKVDTQTRLRIQLNSDTGSNYTQHYISGNGSGVVAAGAASQTFLHARDFTGANAAANTFGVGLVDLHDYANTSKNTTVRGVTGEERNGDGTIVLWSGAWLNTNAVSTILIYPESDNWLAGSTFALYGIKAAA